MTLYVPRRNRIVDDAQAFELIRTHGFATLITPTGADCFVTHLPLVLDSKRRQLLGHLALANDHHLHLGDRPSIAIFHGPHAYMSASWYPDATVPTWNYAVCHVHGTASIIDECALREQLAKLTEQYESDRADPWRDPANETDKLIHRIVGLCMPIDRIDAKFKLDQQYEAVVVNDLARRLEEDDPGDTPHQALARMMKDSVD